MLQFRLSASNQRPKYPSAKHTYTWILSSEEGGDVQAQLTENVLTTFLFIYLFIYLVLNLFDRGVQWFISGKTGSGGGVFNIFQGVKLLIPISDPVYSLLGPSSYGNI